MRKISRLAVVAAVAVGTFFGMAGFASAAPAMLEPSRHAAPRPVACVVIQTAKLLKHVDGQSSRTRAAREAAVRAAIAQARSNCAPAPYAVRVEAVQGRDASTGTLRISCRQGFELSPTDPPGAYFIRFGALTPESFVRVTRTARTLTSYEIDYAIEPQTPASGGIYLEGTCVPVPR